jgi:polygalacturonase
MAIIYPMPDTEPVSSDFSVKINGENAGVYRCRVSAMPYNTVWPGRQRPVEQTETASFISFGIADGIPASLCIEASREFQEVAIRPLSADIHPKTEGKTIDFEIAKPGKYTVELDGFHNALHIFANKTEDYGIDKAGQNVIYFGPGTHRPGLIELKSGQTLFVDAGAVVHTAVTAENCRNIRIIGHGVIDNSEFHRTGDKGQHASSCAVFKRCENIEVRGVTFRDACAWTLTAWGCENIIIDNAKAVGMWRYNSDGFDLCNCRNAVISNCFIRAFDDCVVLKGFPQYDDKNVENIIVSGCVVWCD